MGHMVTLLGDCQTVLQRGIPLSFITMVCRVPDVSTPLFKLVGFFQYCHPRWCEMVSHMDLTYSVLIAEASFSWSSVSLVF